MALLVLFLAAPRVHAQSRLKIATLVPEGSLWDKALRRMGATIQEGTAGRVSLQIYPGGVAGDEPDLLRKMRIGQLHAAMLSSSGLGDIDSSFLVFQIPLLFRTDEEVQFVLKEMSPDFEKRLRDKGFVLVHWGHAGWLQIFSTKPIDSYASFQGMKQFVWGSESQLGRWYQELGLRPVPLSATDVLTGLQTGLIEALPVTPLAALSLQWFRSAPYMLDHRFAPLVGATIVTESAWKKLSEEDQKACLAAGQETSTFLFREVPQSEAAALSEMAKRGLTITHEAERDEEKWQGLAREFAQRFRTTSVPPELFDRVTGLLEEFRKR